MNDQSDDIGIEVDFDPTQISEASLLERSVLTDYSSVEDLADPSNPQNFGREFINRVYKILKIGSIYEIDHNQTAIAAEEFMAFFNAAGARMDDDQISFLVRDELAIVNGESVRMKRKMQERLNELRDLFSKADIKRSIAFD